MHKFVNPYNFVPFGNDLTQKDKKDKNEVYRGSGQTELLTGWLDVTMTLKTPMIIPDGAHPKYYDIKKKEYVRKKTDKNKSYVHTEYDFMKMINPATGVAEPVVGGSMLRGLLRSSYEAVTNSCVPFLMNDKPMSQRVPLFGALTHRGLLGYANGSWNLYATEKRLEEVIIVPVYGDGNQFYTENLKAIRENEENEKYEIMSHLNKLEEKIKKYKWKNRTICYGLIIKGNGKNRTYMYQNQSLDSKKMSLIGYYMINKDGQIIGGEEGKKTATEIQKGVFLQYNLPVDITKIYHVAYLTKKKIEGNKYEVVRSWKGKARELEAYTKLKSALKRDGGSGRNANQFCNEALKNALENACNGKGNLVPVYYFAVEDPRVKDSQERKIIYMSGSAAGRIAQRRKWIEIMDGHTPCKKQLCPACLLFGTIQDGGMRGHIRVTDGFMKNPQEAEFIKHTLQVLATPRSTAFEFYLEKPEEKATYWNFDFYGISEGDGESAYTKYYHLDKATPRGRKMYWHHAPSWENNDKTNLNSTMESLENGEFGFKVYFDQVTQDQLQDLIWVITLGENKVESNLQHKIGHAKPLGYGSVKLTVDGGKIRKFERGEQGCFNYSLIDLQDSDIKIKDAMPTSFDLESEVVRSVLKICDAGLTLKNIDYPRIKEKGFIYQWFAKNRTNHKRLQVLPKITNKDVSLMSEKKN